MNILIVDDEALSVNGIAASLNWNELGISNVYKAYNMRQAQDIFCAHPVDILLCDIEMPRGTGIELIEWVQAQGYEPVSIFLTCFSHFEYASSAIRLQVFDYVLKPCEYNKLAQILARAVIRVNETQAKKHKEKLAGYWDDDYGNLIAGFWNELLQGTIPSDKEFLCHILNQRHLDISLLENKYYLLLLQSVPDKEIDGWNNNLWKFAIQNIMEESLINNVLIAFDQTFISIIPSYSYPELNEFEKSCQSLIDTLHNILPAEFFGYIAPPCSIDQVFNTYRELKQDASKRYALQSTLFLHGKDYSARTLPNISIERWQNALLAHNLDIVQDDIQIYLSPTEPGQFIDSHLLYLIYHQLLKAIYYVLDIHNLPTHQPFLSKEAADTGNAFNSITDFCIWTHTVTEKTVELISSKDPVSVVITTLTRYIQDNINNDLTRTELANFVHLHPDYLSTMFHRKMGISLSEYITRERIQAAKKLLISTDLPISEVATRTGFQTISYFSKQFKRLENMTPYQFRNK